MNNGIKILEENVNGGKVIIVAYLLAFGLINSNIVLEISYSANNGPTITQKISFSKSEVIKSQGECINILFDSAFLSNDIVINIKDKLLKNMDKLEITILPKHDDKLETYIQLIEYCEQLSDTISLPVAISKNSTENAVYYFIDAKSYKEFLKKAGVKSLDFIKYLITDFNNHEILKSNRSTGYGYVKTFSIDGKSVQRSGYLIKDIRNEIYKNGDD